METWMALRSFYSCKISSVEDEYFLNTDDDVFNGRVDELSAVNLSADYAWKRWVDVSAYLNLQDKPPTFLGLTLIRQLSV